MFYKVAVVVAALAIGFLTLSSKVKKVQAYTRYYDNYYQYGYYYGGTTMAWYIWILISGGIFGTVVAIIVCCICCRRRQMGQRGHVVGLQNTNIHTVAGVQGPYVSGVAPGYVQPGQPGYIQPGQPGYIQPGPPGYIQPGQPVAYQAYPQQPMYPQTGTTYPQDPNFKMPEPPPYDSEAPSYTEATTGNFGHAVTQGKASDYPNPPPSNPDYSAPSSHAYDNQAAETSP